MSLETEHAEQPWKHLHDLVESGDSAGLTEGLHALGPVEVVRAVSQLADEQRGRLFELVLPAEAAGLIDRIPEAQAVDALESLAPDTAARILEGLPSNEQADLIGELDEAEAEAILAEMPAAEAQEVRDLSSYPEGTAGSLMITEFLRFDRHLTVEAVIAELQENAERYADYDVQYAYVSEPEGRLVGVLRLRDLLLGRRKRRIDTLMVEEPHRLLATAELAEVVAFFDEHRLFGAPIVDSGDRIVGVVRRSAVEEAIADESDEAFRHSQGIVGGEELRSMPTLVRSRRRLTWLSVNVVLNMAAASVIAMHQDTLETVIALAVFLPIISDMSGCSGSQAVAVSIRELTLGVCAPGDLRRVVGKELAVGLVNGAALGLLLGLVGWAWTGNPWLGLVTGGALALNTLLSVCVGGAVPLALKKAGKDPALASGPILTTVTDASGFFLVLTMASALLSRLAPA